MDALEKRRTALSSRRDLGGVKINDLLLEVEFIVTLPLLGPKNRA